MFPYLIGTSQKIISSAVSDAQAEASTFLRDIEELDHSYENRMFLISRAEDNELSFREVYCLDAFTSEF